MTWITYSSKAAICLAAILTGVYAAKDTALLQASMVQSSHPTSDARLRAMSEQQLVRSLGTEPLQSAALRSLSQRIASYSSRSAEAELPLRLADRSSRRDPATQLLLLNREASAGNLAATMRHYDALMATEPALGSVLRRTLVAALADRRIMDALAAYRDRHWFLPFLTEAARSAGDPRPVFALALRTGQLGPLPQDSGLVAALTQSLVEAGHVQEVIQLADATDTARQWRSFELTEQTSDQDRGPLFWHLLQHRRLRHEFRENGVLSVMIDPMANVQLARRVTVLEPGRLRFEHRASSDIGSGASVEWRVACLGAAAPRELARQAFQVTPASTLNAMTVDLSADCSMQQWELWVSGSDSQTASTINLSGLRITRL